MQRLKALIGVGIVVVSVYLLWKIMPPYIAEYEFQQAIQDIARHNEYAPVNESGIRDLVKKQITEIGVPIDPDSVVIQKSGFDVTIGVNYTAHIDAALHPFDLEFHPATKNGEKIDPIPSAPAR